MGLSKKFENIIVHIGSHKTGSTSIQKYLTQNQARLGDVGVFRYDNKGKQKKVSQNNQLVSVYEQDGIIVKEINPKSLQYLEKLSRNNRVILSAENLFWIDSHRQIEKLQSHLDDLSKSITIVVYLRRQDLCAVSHKSQGCKGGPASLIYGHDLTPLPSLNNPDVERYFDYHSKISAWGDIFGDENLMIRVYEKDLLKNGDVVSDFLDCCNINYYSPPEKSGRFNPSLSRDKQLFLHEIRSFLPKKEEINILISEVSKMNKKEMSDNTNRFLPSKENAYLFYNYFKHSNILLNERFKISDKTSIFEEDFSFYPDEEDNVLERSELIRIFSEAFKNIVFKKDRVMANFLRDMALKIESSNIDVAKELMEKAYQLRPSGKVIKKKVLEYRSQTRKDNQNKVRP